MPAASGSLDREKSFFNILGMVMLMLYSFGALLSLYLYQSLIVILHKSRDSFMLFDFKRLIKAAV